MTIWQALNLYRDKYALPSSSWHAMAITVDKLTNRDVFYFLGHDKDVEQIKGYTLEDGSCNYYRAIAEHIKSLELIFIMNNRTGVLDVYKSNGILENSGKGPLRVHMQKFIDAVMTLTGTTEEIVKVIPKAEADANHEDIKELLGVDVPVSTGRDSGLENGAPSEEWLKSDKIDFSESLPSKYGQASVRALAAQAAGFKVDKKLVEKAIAKEKGLASYVSATLGKLLGKKEEG